jgi:type I pantothenate kinase
MDIRAPDQDYNPYRIFTREQWARLRDAFSSSPDIDVR